MKRKTHFIAKLFINILLVICIGAVVTIPLWMMKYQQWLSYSDSQYYNMMAMLFCLTLRGLFEKAVGYKEENDFTV